MNLRDMVHAQDYDSGKYVGSALEPIAAPLASLCQGMETSKQVGGMKKKIGNRVGGMTKHRLGSQFLTSVDFVEGVDLVLIIILLVHLARSKSLGGLWESMFKNPK